MRGARTPRLLAIAALAAALLSLAACLALAAPPLSNDYICSGGERGAMSEFPHHGGAEPGWETNPKVTGGCATTYVAAAATEDVREYYRERLARRGWTVEVGPANSFPIHLAARRGGLAYYLYFAGAESDDALRPGRTRVAIHGGHDG